MRASKSLQARIPDPTPFALVDAFGDGPFTGNPAGVCVLAAPAPERWMASVAAEVGASETAFLSPADDGWLLRWFTPALEVDLCGHATLASAHVLLPEAGTVRFRTRSGLLHASRLESGEIALDFPRVATWEAAPDPAIAAALGQTPVWVGRTSDDLVCVLASPTAVESAEPRLDRLAGLAPRGVAITASGGADADITSRFFAPAAGIPEDPVTGSVHCALAPLWCEWLGRTSLRARQASPRGGVLELALTGGDRVELRGRATTVIAGTVVGP